MFLRHFGLGILAFEIGERYVQRLVTEANVYRVLGYVRINFQVADDTSRNARCTEPQGSLDLVLSPQP